MIRLDKHLATGDRSSPISSQPERELKLAVDPNFRIPRLPGTPLPRRQLISTYYDTVAYDLAHAKITLRHRTERGKKSWQLKIPWAMIGRKWKCLTIREIHRLLSAIC